MTFPACLIGLLAATVLPSPTTKLLASPAELYRSLGYEAYPLTRLPTSGWYYVTHTANGARVASIVDTGAAFNVLDISYVSTNSSSLLPEEAMEAAAAKKLLVIDEQTTFYPRVGFGALSVPVMRYGTINLRKMAFRQENPAHLKGILGAPFLRYYSAVIDYSSDTLYLLDPAKREAGLQGDWEEIDLVSEGESLNQFPGRTAVAKLSIRGSRGTFDCAGTTQQFDLALNLKATPRSVDWVYPNGYPKPLIYKLDGDTLTIAGQLFETKQKLAERPKDFVSRPDTAISVLTLKRVPRKPK